MPLTFAEAARLYAGVARPEVGGEGVHEAMIGSGLVLLRLAAVGFSAAASQRSSSRMESVPSPEASIA